MDTGRFNVLADGVNQELTVVGDSIDVDLFGIINELGNDDWVVGRNIACRRELLFEIFFRSNDRHGGSGQDVAGSNQDRVADVFCKLLCLLDGS